MHAVGGDAGSELGDAPLEERVPREGRFGWRPARLALGLLPLRKGLREDVPRQVGVELSPQGRELWSTRREEGR